ncbi:glycosyltransferase family 2 protein [Methylibium sp.]|uniref:glycosyltransferase family 2 protein n=1 Tax=Methylibium sp. TaxID=2067992 RepID=UPI003D0C495A
MLHIILPVHNRSPITARFLNCVRAQSFQNYCLVLVNDGCTDNTLDLAQQLLPSEQMVILAGNGKLWWAGALQKAFEYLTAIQIPSNDDVLIINDDTYIDPDFLANGLALLAEHPRACIQALGTDRRSGRVDRGVVVDLSRLRFRPAKRGESVNCLSTRGLLMKASTFCRSGGFRPQWLPHYLSDYEFTIRLQRAGYLLLCEERFAAEMDDSTSGLNSYPQRDLREFLKLSFSNRAKFNPRHWSAFVILTCPAKSIPLHLAKIWFGFSRALLHTLLSGQ